MTAAVLPMPARRSIAIDPRLPIGLALVLASVAGVVGVVAAADATTTVYAAAGALAPGQRVTADDLVERHVVLDGADARYLTPQSLPSDGAVALRAVGAGELVPVGALGAADGVRLTSLVVETSARLSAAIVPGAPVDVWAAVPSVRMPGTTEEATAPVGPTVLVADAGVVRVLEQQGMTVDGGGVAVEVRLPRGSVADLLQAVADGAELSLVPAGLPIGADG